MDNPDPDAWSSGEKRRRETEVVDKNVHMKVTTTKTNDQNDKLYGNMGNDMAHPSDTVFIMRRAAIYGVDEHMARTTTFQVFLENIRQASVIQIMDRLIFRVCTLTVDIAGDIVRKQSDVVINPRIFMLSYLVVFFPSKVFESMGSAETELQDVATLMLEVFECMRNEILSGVAVKDAAKNAAAFTPRLFEYLESYKRWKQPDELKLTSRIKHALQALFNSELLLRVDDVNTVTIRKEFHAQQDHLMSKALQIAGEEGVNEMQALRVKVMGGVCTRPRVDPSNGHRTSIGFGCIDRHIIRSTHLTREELTYELLLDKTFRPRTDENGVYCKIRESFQEAFWNSIEDDLRLSPPSHLRCMRILIEITDSLSDIQAPALAGSTYPLFDLGQVKNELHVNKTVAWTGYIHVVRCIVDGIKDAYAEKEKNNIFWNHPSTRKTKDAAMCKIKKKWNAVADTLCEATGDVEIQPRIFVKALDAMRTGVKELHIELAKDHLNQVAPAIISTGIQYLIDVNDKKFNIRRMPLDVTSEYVKTAISVCLATKRVDMQDLLHNRIRTTSAHHETVTSVVMSAFFRCNTHEMPETLRMDKQRFRTIQARLEIHTLAAAVVGVVHSILKSPCHSSTNDVQATLQAIGMCTMNSTLRADDFGNRVSEVIEALPFDMPETTVECISATLTSNLVKGSAVLKLYEKRMNTILFKTFHSNDQDIFSNISPHIMLVIGTELRKYVHVLRMVVGIHIRVYGSHYNRIIQEQACTMSMQ